MGRMSPKLLTGAARAAGLTLLRAQSDARLATLAAAGHEAAFEAIVDRYRPHLVRYCTRLVGAGRAEDAVQQALLNAHVAMPSATIDNLRAWLYRVAHNSAVSILRSSRDESVLDERLAAPRQLQEDIDARQRLRRAFEAIAALPEPQRDALMLRAIEGRSHEEIAAALDVSPAAARQTIHRARSTLRAAVTAITPYPLLVRLAAPGAWAGSGGGVPELVAGGGALTATKVGTAIIAAGAITGGAMTLPARQPDRAAAERSPAKRAETRPEPRPRVAAALPVTAVAPPTPLVSRPGDDGGAARGGGKGDDGPRHAATAPDRDETHDRADDEGSSGSGDREHDAGGDREDDREARETTHRDDDGTDRPRDDGEVEDREAADEPTTTGETEDRSSSGHRDEETVPEPDPEPAPEDEDHSGPG